MQTFSEWCLDNIGARPAFLLAAALTAWLVGCSV